MTQAWETNDNYYLAGSLGAKHGDSAKQGMFLAEILDSLYTCIRTVTEDKKKLHRDFLGQGGQFYCMCLVSWLEAYATNLGHLRAPDEETTHCCPACSSISDTIPFAVNTARL